MLTIIIPIAVFVGVAALVGGIALLLRGGSNGEVENRLEVLTGAAGPSGKDLPVHRQTVLAQPLDDRPGMLETVFSRFGNLRRFVEQAGLSVSPTKFLLISLGLAAAGGGVFLVTGFYPAAAPLAAALLGALPFLGAFLKRKRRLAAFGKQLPGALELIARALRAGHSLASGFQLVGSEVPEPLGVEFAQVFEQQNLGIPLEDALDTMTERVPNIDLRFFATAVILQRQTGGDLAEILDKIGRLIRERFKIHGQIQALTGEGRLSGIVLLALPPALFLVMLYLNPGYVMTLFQDPMGKQMLAGAIILQVVGALVIRKIISIKV